ncbi:hypothetical protein L7F22_003756 [Adiantum nelumboides]|nr:hypothetical protein [Adiantum nelumboides]
MLQAMSDILLQVNHTNQALLSYITTHSQKTDSKICPKPFSGLPTEDVLTWLDHFDNVDGYRQWSADRRTMEARTLFEGVAATWFVQQSADVKGDWNCLKINLAVQEMLEKRVITPSSSEWASEFHLVHKDDGSYTFCIDFRPLNKVTIHDLYPLPRIDDLLDQLGKLRYFTSLDLASGYWQIPLDPSDAHKTAFRTPNGLFKFTRMPFGLSDAASTFQRTAHTVFLNLIQQGVLLVYLDDILIHTPTWTQHLEVLQEVLTQIHKHNLQLQLKKCKWGTTKLRFLGFIVSVDGVEMDPAKVKAIQN